MSTSITSHQPLVGPEVAYKEVSASETIDLSLYDTFYATGTITLTMPSTLADYNGRRFVIKNVGSGDVTVAVGSGDSFDGTTDGTMTIPPGGAVAYQGRQFSSGASQWETVWANYIQTSPVTFVDVDAARETVVLEKIRFAIQSGTSVGLQFTRNGSSIDNAAATATTTETGAGAVLNSGGDSFGPETVFDGNRLSFVTSSATGTPSGLSVTYRLVRTTWLEAS
jgi:hypothetical protein